MWRATMLPGEDGHSCAARRWHLTSPETTSTWQDSATRVLWSFTCKHSTQLTIRTAQGTTGPTITECTTYSKLHREGQIIPNYILLVHLHTSLNINVLLDHCHFKIWRSFVLWPGFTRLHLKHRYSLSIPQWPACWLGDKKSGFLQHLRLMLVLSVSCK